MARRSGTNVRARKRRWLPWVAGIIVALGLFAAFKVFGPNTGALTEGKYLYIRTGSTYADVQKALEEGGFVRDMKSFDLLARQAGYPDRVKAGKYEIDKGMSNYAIVRLLRSGRQTPVKLLITKLRTKNDFVRLVAKNLEADSAVLRHMLADPVYLAQFGVDTNTAMTVVIPDTYEFYWNTNADKAFRKIAKNHTAFWDTTRRQLAKNLGLTPQQVYTIASLVEEETNMAKDKPLIASVYINRLRQGIRLQADPTVKFAIGDFSLRRITGKHLGVNSPYNTYMYAGLPPGPISTPSKKTLDAVLHSPQTKFIYFCAREDFSGYSNFAATYPEHQANARRYQAALDVRGIK